MGNGRGRDGSASGGTTRRRVLAGAGALALGGSAGCSTDADGVKHASDVFGHAFPFATESTQLNPWLSGSYPWSFHTLLFEVQSLQTPGAKRQLGDVVEDVAIDGTTVTVEYSDEFTWWNGEPVTARDQWVYERIQSHVSDEDRPAVDLRDEYALVYEFDRPLDEPLVLSHVVGSAVNTPAWLFGQWVDRFEDASTEAAHEEVVEDLHSWRISLEDAVEMGIGCGPYRLVEASMNRLILERFDDHPQADSIAIPRLWFPVVKSVSIDKLIETGTLDGGHGLLDGRKGTPADYLEQLARYPTTGGAKLALDWRNPHLGRRAVRRAILALLPLDEVVAVGGFGETTAVQTGMATPAERRWFDEGFVDGLREYPVQADVERATEYVQSVGYTRDGSGDWYGPDGDRAWFRLRSPMWSDWKAAGELLRQALTEFGFDVDFSQIPDVRLASDVDTHNFDVLLWPSDGTPHNLYDVTSTWATTLGYGVSEPETPTSVNGKPVNVTVPAGGGDGQRTANLVEVWRRLAGQTDRATTADAIATFARWWNHDLPDVHLATDVSGTWGNTRDFEWVGDREAYRTAGPENQSAFHALKQGLVRPRRT